jgi:hypothetical protein
MKTLKFARIAATTIALAVGGAHAALITSWNVTDVAGFDPLTVQPGGNTYPNPVLSNGGLSLRWGEAATANGQSGLDIVNQPLQTTTLGVPVTTVSVTHLNWPIYQYATSALTSVDIFATINLNPTGWSTPPDAVKGGITFKVKFIETPNLSAGQTCADGTIAGGNGCPDIFVINNVPADFSFVMPDWDLSGSTYQYDVSFIGTGFTALSDGACAAAGASNGCLGFETPENANTTADFQVAINGHKVPEPGSRALLGLGLLGLGAARRRKSAK